MRVDFVITCFSLFFFANFIFAKNIKPNVDATVFEFANKSGRHFSYVPNAEYFSNMERLFRKSEIANPKLLCVNGPWLVYKHRDNKAQILKSVQLFSGDDLCMQQKDKNLTDIGSMQPIGPSKLFANASTGQRRNSITFFEKKLYSSFGLPHGPKGREVSRLEWTWLPTLGSLITMGNTPWTLISYSNKLVCIRPGKEASGMKHPICFLQDTAIEGLDKYKFAAVVPNCSTDASLYAQTTELSSCLDYGKSTGFVEIPEVLPKNKTAEPNKTEVTVKPVEEGCPPAEVEQRKLDAQELNEQSIRQLAYIRFTHDFSNSIQVLWPERQEDIWKAGLFDTIYQIALTSIPDEIVPTVYLQTAREFTMFHLDKAWRNGTMGKNSSNSTLEPKILAGVTDLLSTCADTVIEHSNLFESKLWRPFLMIRNPHYLLHKIRPEFRRNNTLDQVIETSWVVANYVYALCSHMLDFTSDFWMDYVQVVQELYFKPLAKTWKNSTITARSYTAIFGGLGIKSIHKRLAFAASTVFNEFNNLKPLQKSFLP